jgi:signal transduction histidine kinase
VLDNLLSNALKYGERQPVEIAIEGDETTVRLTVRDHGIGIPPDAQERIFQRFERLVPVRHFGGFGLGLWIVRQIIEAHGGRVEVESRPEEGSTFTVELPRVVIMDRPTEAETGSEAQAS